MTKKERLRREAHDSTTGRGHVMLKFDHHGPHRCVSQCLYCSAYVVVNSKPWPNQTELCGTALALECPSQ